MNLLKIHIEEFLLVQCQQKLSNIFFLDVAYHISSNKRWTSNKHHTLISAELSGIDIEISASPLVITTPPNAVLIRMVTIFY